MAKYDQRRFIDKDRPGDFIAPVPKGFIETARTIGPGIVIALCWLGVGDLIDASVAGANYGYAFIWVFVIALTARWFFTSIIAKAYMCNSHQDASLFTGFRRLWKPLPIIVGAFAFIAGFGSQVAAAVAVGSALYHLTGGLGGETWGIFLWTLLASCVAILMLSRKNQYRALDIIARIAVACLLAIFLGAALYVGPDYSALGRGLLFDVPKDEGIYGSMLVLAAVIGTAGVSATNLIYPEFLREKGWRTPKHLRVQRVDLAVGVAAIVVVDLAVWVVGAEVAKPRGIAIEGPEELSSIMEVIVGGFGPTMLWIGVFFAAFTTFTAQATGFTSMLLAGVRETFGSGARAHRHDRLFNPIQIVVMLIVPVIFALPGFPNVVALTLISGATLAALAPIVLIAILWATNSKKVIFAENRNRWWENVIAVAIGCVGVWSAYGLVISLL